MKAPAYLAGNPMCKVLAIHDGNTVVTENAAICLYLADLAPNVAWRGQRSSAPRRSMTR